MQTYFYSCIQMCPILVGDDHNTLQYDSQKDIFIDRKKRGKAAPLSSPRLLDGDFPFMPPHTPRELIVMTDRKPFPETRANPIPVREVGTAPGDTQ